VFLQQMSRRAEMAENKVVAAAARALEQSEQAEAAATTAGRQAWAFGFASYAVTGFYGLALMRGEPQSDAVIPKAGAVLLMAPLALNLGASVVGEDSSRYARRICAGLIFCAGGDACLALEDSDAYKDVKQLLFLGGLGCFLVGHLLYMSAFAANRFKVRKVVAGAILVYVLSICIVLYPSLPTALIAPVLLCKAELARACVPCTSTRPLVIHRLHAIPSILGASRCERYWLDGDLGLLSATSWHHAQPLVVTHCHRRRASIWRVGHRARA